jgi:hypothetical protein
MGESRYPGGSIFIVSDSVGNSTTQLGTEEGTIWSLPHESLIKLQAGNRFRSSVESMLVKLRFMFNLIKAYASDMLQKLEKRAYCRQQY